MFKELKFKYILFTISEKLIFWTIAIFGLIAVITSLTFLFEAKEIEIIRDYFTLSSEFKDVLFKPWTLFTYQFVHFGFKHMLMNMISLYFFGRIFLIFFNTKQFLSYYLLGGVFAGIIFMISFNLFPALVNTQAYLLGASASIFSIVVGVSTLKPNYNFNLLGLFKIPLWIISVLYILLFISSIPYGNSGGQLAHLGGAVFGYIYTTQLVKGNDIGKSFEKLIDTISSWFKSSKKTPFKKVHKTKRKSKVAGVKKEDFDQFSKQKKIDLILDKISKNGYDSLTAEEKEFLFRAGK